MNKNINKNNFKLRYKYISILYKLENKYTYDFYRHLTFKNVNQYLGNFLYKLKCVKTIQKQYRQYVRNKNFHLIQTNIILKEKINELLNKNDIVINLKKQIFKQSRIIDDKIYKISEQNKQIQLLNKCKNNNNDYEIMKKSTSYIDYNAVPKLSNYKLIQILINEYDYKYCDIKNLSKHELKQYLNRHNNKYNRLFQK